LVKSVQITGGSTNVSKRARALGVGGAATGSGALPSGGWFRCEPKWESEVEVLTGRLGRADQQEKGMCLTGYAVRRGTSALRAKHVDYRVTR